MSPRKIGAISMRPVGNDQGGHYCISLMIGRLLNQNNATPLPMPRKVIYHVHRIAHRAPVGLIFSDRNNVAFPDISYDDKVVDVSDSESNNSDNNVNPSKAADSEAADPEGSVKIT